MDDTNTQNLVNGNLKSAELLFRLPLDKAAQVLRELTKADVVAVGLNLYRYYGQPHKTIHPPKKQQAKQQADQDNTQTHQSLEDHASLLYRKVGSPANESRAYESPAQVDSNPLIFIRKLYNLAFGAQKGEALTHKLVRVLFSQKFYFLRSYSASQIYQVVQHESDQLLALLIVCLESQHSAALLALFSPEKRKNIVKAIITVSEPNPQIFETIKTTLEQKLSTLETPAKETQPDKTGADTLAQILSHLPTSMRTTITDYLDDKDLKQQIVEKSFSWKGLSRIPIAQRQEILREYSMRELALCVVGQGKDAYDFVSLAISKSNTILLQEEIQLLSELPRTQKELQVKANFLARCHAELSHFADTSVSDAPIADTSTNNSADNSEIYV